MSWNCVTCGQTFDDTRSWSAHVCPAPPAPVLQSFVDKLRAEPGLVDDLVDTLDGRDGNPLSGDEQRYVRMVVLAWAARVEAAAVPDRPKDEKGGDPGPSEPDYSL